MHFLPYSYSLKDFSRELRKHSTLSEVLFWQRIKGKQFRGYQFNRQKPLGNFIVDFYCKKLDLVIEIDGDSHFHETSVVNDQKRQQILENSGLIFFRILDIDVKNRMSTVLNLLNDSVDKIEIEKGLERT
ncbi:endonuclease domain-containing protein [Algoriphagus sp. SE2]|uniref:endonuclease domain-containing protein n=1 Tax=Algoriphagus sp. SE2 TaxID=3141536 RepID=UPI0031CCF9BB